ncbi:hypothetical protein [Actinokineospora globicatena]|uniref:Uncharacterized protein n=1 Tax=Actinokineospora globicatena TaxID=103729 RepID=A0A9W6QM76_9PSEU|nr:hypothetical protein [Actinokineospora globicatena]GLW93481.1 hypothetical protein Aglo03_42970 [Actinokineospora globicatena]
MDVIEPRGVRDFLRRFDSFEDSVLTGVEFVLPRTPSGRSITVDIQARDAEVSGDVSSRYRLVRLQVGDFDRYRFAGESRTLATVLTDGVAILRDGDFWVVDLDPGADPWSHERLAVSEQYIVGRELRFSVSDGPYI